MSIHRPRVQVRKFCQALRSLVSLIRSGWAFLETNASSAHSAMPSWRCLWDSNFNLVVVNAVSSRAYISYLQVSRKILGTDLVESFLIFLITTKMSGLPGKWLWRIRKHIVGQCA